MELDIPDVAADALVQGQRGKRVAIIGAGPGGLSAGIALHQAGFDVKIFERNSTIHALGGAILLNAIGVYIMRSYDIKMQDLCAVSVAEFRRYDGHFRARWKTDPEVLEAAGVDGWISGMMRSDVYERLLSVLPAGMIVPSSKFTGYTESDRSVTAHFDGRPDYEADLLIGADGINSVVREQLWGTSELKHLGIAVWLGWAELDGPPRSQMIMHHSDRYQLGYAPLRYQGRDCFEYWFVEPCTITQAPPADPIPYIKERTRNFASPVPELLSATDPSHLFRWVVKGRAPLKRWSQGRVTLMGDASHPTSPYAGYGAGMAIEDGFFLGRYLAGVDLTDPQQVTRSLARYENERVGYCNRVTEFARTLGTVFHNAPWPLRRFRDFMLDHTRIPDKQINKGYTEDAQVLLRSLLDSERATAD